MLGAGQVRTCQRGDFKAADTGQCLQRLVGAQTVQYQGALDHFGLVAAAAAVVLPMPISPPMNSWAPLSMARKALSRPACNAAASCPSVIAGWRAKLAVPAPRRK
ncbi:hypothetical protein WR25_23551 [Diploscapter pachys]|uniref:Uncharacterized protein n=1 Tax=Diploscapter pachys TaxID=2018661 RepID=A0A2A2KBE7_9BILA|nr:hypothetical protein WR25_23551 [Diploscapter pachys]